MVGIFPLLFILWKLLKRTSFVSATKADLIWEAPLIDAYEASFLSPPTGFWKEMVDLVRFRKAQDDGVVSGISIELVEGISFRGSST